MSNLHHSSSNEHLLRSNPAYSIRSSRPASVFTTDTVDTTVTPALAQASSSPAESQPYRGFPSQEAYLAALRNFIDSKMHFSAEQQLIGFYGTKTSDYYMSKPTLAQDRKMRKEKKDRRATVAKLGSLPEEQGATGSAAGLDRVKTTATTASDQGEDGEGQGKRRSSKLGRVFGRRATVV